jgi:DNA polymerase-4
MAKRFMPDLKIVEERPAAYFEAAETVLSISERFVPVVDVEKQDAFALDLTGTDRLYPEPVKLLRALQNEIRKEINIPSRAGLGVSRLVARLASMRAGKKGIMEVPVGQEGEFLADYHVGVLPGVGVQIAKRLQWLGVHTVRELAMVPVQTLEAAFGPKGLEIARTATGHDPRPRRRAEQIKPIKREIPLEQIIYDPREIRAGMQKLVAGLGLDLRKMGMQVRTIGFEIRYPDIPPHRRRKAIPPTDLDCSLERIVIDMYNSMSVRRVRLRGLVLSYGRLIPSDNQLRLEFARDRTLDRRKNLEHAMDRIRNKYGVDTIGPAPWHD